MRDTHQVYKAYYVYSHHQRDGCNYCVVVDGDDDCCVVAAGDSCCRDDYDDCFGGYYVDGDCCAAFRCPARPVYWTWYAGASGADGLRCDIRAQDTQNGVDCGDDGGDCDGGPIGSSSGSFRGPRRGTSAPRSRHRAPAGIFAATA